MYRAIIEMVLPTPYPHMSNLFVVALLGCVDAGALDFLCSLIRSHGEAQCG